MKGGTPQGSLDKWEGIAMVEAVQGRSNKVSRDSRPSTRNYVHAGKNDRKQGGSNYDYHESPLTAQAQDSGPGINLNTSTRNYCEQCHH